MAKFLIDECVPKSVSDFLKTTSHEVHLVKEVLLEGTPDQVVAKIAEEQQAIIVTWNVKDFRKEIKKFEFGILAFKCPEPEAAGILEREFDYIDFALNKTQKEGTRFWLEVQKSGIKLYRPQDR